MLERDRASPRCSFAVRRPSIYPQVRLEMTVKCSFFKGHPTLATKCSSLRGGRRGPRIHASSCTKFGDLDARTVPATPNLFPSLAPQQLPGLSLCRSGLRPQTPVQALSPTSKPGKGSPTLHRDLQQTVGTVAGNSPRSVGLRTTWKTEQHALRTATL